ncbi:MAG: hypothetical protein QG635_2291 [Bacteroidota bacterium]|nr:hypothetical protein [Bacteroidota bacterium]
MNEDISKQTDSATLTNDDEIKNIGKSKEEKIECNNRPDEKKEFGNNGSDAYQYHFKVSELKYSENNSKSSPFVEVGFKGNRHCFFRNDEKYNLTEEQYVIVEVDNGSDFGRVLSFGSKADDKLKCINGKKSPQYKIIRPATQIDTDKFFINVREEAVVVKRTKELVNQFKLDMKIADAEWQFDRQRLTIYFTAPMRIDFRELVKELARNFRTRIELRQISTREETRRLGDGIGCCGNIICCSLFLNEFCHVTLDHARTQQLSNNVAKLSGNCGRLKCCLLFEFDSYVSAFEKYPPLNSVIELTEGKARILKVDVFKDIIYLYIKEASKYKSISYEELTDFVNNGKVYQPIGEDESLPHDYDKELDALIENDI